MDNAKSRGGYKRDVRSTAFKSAGASSELLRLLQYRRWRLVLSNTLCSEYAEVLGREADKLELRMDQIEYFLDMICDHAERYHPEKPWLPVLVDPDDEAQVHLDFESGVGYIVTHT